MHTVFPTCVDQCCLLLLLCSEIQAWMLALQARLGEVNQPLKHEDQPQALMQRSYPEGSTSRRYAAQQSSMTPLSQHDIPV